MDLHSDVDTMIDQYTTAVSVALDGADPVITCRKQVHQYYPWCDDDIHHSRKLRQVIKTKWRTTGLEIHRQIYVQHTCRNAVNVLINKAKQEYYDDLLSDGDM